MIPQINCTTFTLAWIDIFACDHLHFMEIWTYGVWVMSINMKIFENFAKCAWMGSAHAGPWLSLVHKVYLLILL